MDPQKLFFDAFVYVGVPVAAVAYRIALAAGDMVSANRIKAEYTRPDFPNVGSVFN